MRLTSTTTRPSPLAHRGLAASEHRHHCAAFVLGLRLTSPMRQWSSAKCCAVPEARATCGGASWFGDAGPRTIRPGRGESNGRDMIDHQQYRPLR